MYYEPNDRFGYIVCIISCKSNWQNTLYIYKYNINNIDIVEDI